MAFDASLIRINDVNDLEGYDSYTYLEIEAGLPPTSETIERLGHEPNGYFWEGVARWLLAKRVVGDIGEADPEGGAFLTRGASSSRPEVAPPSASPGSPVPRSSRPPLPRPRSTTPR